MIKSNKKRLLSILRDCASKA